MSRSYKKSCNDKYAFCPIACYFSNKKDKRYANRKFRRKSKNNVNSVLYLMDIEKYKDIYKLKEISDVWDFSSDGLCRCILYDNNWTKEEKRKMRAK